MSSRRRSGETTATHPIVARHGGCPRILGWTRGGSWRSLSCMPAHSPEGTHALLEAAFNAGDRDAFAGVYDENATLIIPPEGERVSGREAIRQAIEATFALQPDGSWRIVLDIP